MAPFATLFFCSLCLESFKASVSNDHVKILDYLRKGICLIQELRKALQQLQGELQSKSQQLHTLEAEKYTEIRTQEQHIQHLHHSLSHKEQLLQVSPQNDSAETGFTGHRHLCSYHLKVATCVEYLLHGELRCGDQEDSKEIESKSVREPR